MKKYSTFIAVAIIAMVLAIGMVVHIMMQKEHFDTLVKEALKTSEGYDQRFIDMVNRLEHELALRAGFGFSGQKDPMTGKVRIVVRNAPIALPRIVTLRSVQAPAVEPVVAIDSVKLTAIIFDDTKKRFTAIIMHGERSFAIEVGERVVGRTVTNITNENVFMEDEKYLYQYEITGKKSKIDK